MSNPLANPWTVDHQAPLSMGFSRQEYWSGLPCAPPGGLPDAGIEPLSPALAGRLFTTSASWETLHNYLGKIIKTSRKERNSNFRVRFSLEGRTEGNELVKGGWEDNSTCYDFKIVQKLIH